MPSKLAKSVTSLSKRQLVKLPKRRSIHAVSTTDIICHAGIPSSGSRKCANYVMIRFPFGIFTPGMKMKVLKLMFLVANFILRFFCGAFCDHGKERSVSINLESQALWRSYIRVLKLWRRVWKGMYWAYYLSNVRTECHNI